MSIFASQGEAAAQPVVVALLPLMAAVLIAFLVIGAAMPVLPLHVHQGLGFSTFVVGLVAGAQFAAALISRLWSGAYADRHGAKRAVQIGLAAAAAAGLLYLLSLRFVGAPFVSVGILLAGRAVLGAAESFIITGATIWGLARVGAHNAGKVIAWMGMAMFGGFAVGAPFGTAMYDAAGFRTVAFLTTLAPLLTLGLIAPLQGAAGVSRRAPGILSVFRPDLAARPRSCAQQRRIWCNRRIRFAAIRWAELDACLAAVLGLRRRAHCCTVCARAFARPHRWRAFAILFALIEAIGLGAMGLAANSWIAAIGAALTGFGYSLVFPALGVEAVRRAPPESRGVAMGAYTACLDLALGVSGPVLGAIGGHTGLGFVFLISATSVLCSAGVAAALQRKVAPSVY